MTPVSFTSLLAAAPVTHTYGEDIAFVFVGFVIVLIILALLATLTAVIGQGFKKQYESAAAARAANAPKMQQAPPPDRSAEEADERRMLAVIAAAVRVTLSERARVVSVRPVGRQGWAAEGRREIHSSHRTR